MGVLRCENLLAHIAIANPQDSREGQSIPRLLRVTLQILLLPVATKCGQCVRKRRKQ